MLISTALLLDSIIRNSVCTLAKLPCRRVEVGYEKKELRMNKHYSAHKQAMTCRGIESSGRVALTLS
jgi:hypothetical protein